MERLNLIAGNAVEPTGNVNLTVRSQQIDQKVAAALLEPQVLVRYAGKKVDPTLGLRTGAVVDHVLAEAGTELISIVPAAAIDPVITCADDEGIVARTAGQP